MPLHSVNLIHPNNPEVVSRYFDTWMFEPWTTVETGKICDDQYFSGTGFPGNLVCRPEDERRSNDAGPAPEIDRDGQRRIRDQAQCAGFRLLELKVTRDDRSVRLHRQAAPVSDDVAAIGWPRYYVLRCPLPQGFDTLQLRLKLSRGVQAVPVPPSAITVTVHPATCAVTEPR